MWLFFSILVVLLLIRLVFLVLSTFINKTNNVKLLKARTLIVLGSGGHTTEMVEIVRKLSQTEYSPRFYVVAVSDQNSFLRLKPVEKDENCKVFTITRSREVKDGYMKSIKSTILSILDCLPLLYSLKPDLILCNGPSTCIPVCYVAFLFKLLFLNRHCKIVFVESLCRVKTLSVSGWLLLPIADIFVVQWPKLSQISRKIQFFGRLM